MSEIEALTEWFSDYGFTVHFAVHKTIRPQVQIMLFGNIDFSRLQTACEITR